MGIMSTTNTKRYNLPKKDLEHYSEELYLNIYRISQEILKDVFDDQRSKDAMVDIRAVAEHFHISIVDSEMYSNRNFFLNEVNGFLDLRNYGQEESQGTIFVNENLGELSKRYVIAHELAHYILGMNCDDSRTRNCVTMLFPEKIEEQLCDMMASFLLMPLESALFLVKDYIDTKREEGESPVSSKECMHYLGYKLKLSDYHVSLCYQNVKYLGAIIYERHSQGLQSEPLVDAYKELFYK